jgi:hypothetical protein
MANFGSKKQCMPAVLLTLFVIAAVKGEWWGEGESRRYASSYSSGPFRLPLRVPFLAHKLVSERSGCVGDNGCAHHRGKPIGPPS